MKIINLQAENVKKLVAVEITPDGNMVQITGKNGQGKTSVLDSIWWALAGTSNIQASPIREGQTQARIRLDMGEIVATRKFRTTKSGEVTSEITVENADGVKIASPQAMLDGLLGQLSFDPLAFARMDAKGQFNALRRFVPQIDFEAIERENKLDYARRTEINRRAKEAKTLALSTVVPANLPPDRMNEADLIDRLQKAAKHNADIDSRKERRARMKEDIIKNSTDLATMEHQRDALNVKIAAAEELIGKMSDQLEAAAPLPEPMDAAALREEINSAKEINTKIALREEKEANLDLAKELEEESAVITTGMEKREADKLAAIAAANIPAEGISFGDNAVLLRGVPFNQGSDAEQLRASIEIAMALNPKLKVIRVRDGSLLDDDSMKLLAEIADVKDYQIWIERVDGSGKVGFVLEDGHIKQNLIMGDE